MKDLAEKLTHKKARKLIEPFYDLFRAEKRDWEKGMAVLADDWKAYYTNDKFRTKKDTRGFLDGLFNLVPDINVEIIEFFIDGDVISVRSELTGTPAGDFLVQHSGRKFSIMTIDIHKVKDGKIVELYHAEDWQTAIRQLSGEE